MFALCTAVTRLRPHLLAYSNAKRTRETLELLGKLFQYRTCEGPEPGRRSGVPCLDYYIKRCQAPCVGYIDREEYRQAITDGFYFRDRARRGYLTADQLPEAPPDAFKAASVDGDDRLSLQEEVNALLKDFEAADVNNDGALTYGELEAYVTRSRR